MKKQKARILFWGSFLLLAASGLILHVFWGESLLTQALFHLENVMKDGTRARETILSFGVLAPLMFMVLQILQVLFAPVPGEATGILGGYLFGAWPSFIFSSIALAVGSAFAFAIGHLFADAFRDRFSKTRIYRILLSPLFFFSSPVFPKIRFPTCWG
jgi:uncharacterized membrane protein YdjX (TVP38/TMEM64 family)